MMNRAIVAGTLAIGILTLAGCDPVRTVCPAYRVRLTDETGAPLASAQLQMKLDFDRTFDASTMDPEAKERAREFWLQLPWTSGVTDAEGFVTLAIETTALDRSRSATPSASRDVVQGQAFLVRLTNGSEPQDLGTLVMNPGAMIQNPKYLLTIVDIGPPTYVPTPR
jgi:hypothetical protein